MYRLFLPRAEEKWGFGFSFSTSLGHEWRHDPHHRHLIRQNKEAAQSHCEKATSPVTKEGPGFLVHLLLGHCLNSRTAKAQTKCSRHEAANATTATWFLFPSFKQYLVHEERLDSRSKHCFYPTKARHFYRRKAI